MRMRYLQAFTNFNSGLASGHREVNRADNRQVSPMLLFPKRLACPSTSVLSIVITLGRVKLAPWRTRVVVAAGTGRQQACEVGALRGVVWGSLLEASKASIGLVFPHLQKRQIRTVPWEISWTRKELKGS